MNLATTGMPAQKQAGKKRGRGSVATESVAGTKGDGAEGAEDERESSEAWAEWEKEMQQYPGWEQGGGQPAHQSGPVSAVKDELTSVLLEDMDCRASILATMVEAGLPAATVREIFASHVRLFTADLGAGPAAGEQWRVDGNGMTRRHLAISRTSEACGVRALARKRCGESCNDARLINTVCVYMYRRGEDARVSGARRGAKFARERVWMVQIPEGRHCLYSEGGRNRAICRNGRGQRLACIFAPPRGG